MITLLLLIAAALGGGFIGAWIQFKVDHADLSVAYEIARVNKIRANQVRREDW